jgi:hypothetical protein
MAWIEEQDWINTRRRRRVRDVRRREKRKRMPVSPVRREPGVQEHLIKSFVNPIITMDSISVKDSCSPFPFCYLASKLDSSSELHFSALQPPL